MIPGNKRLDWIGHETGRPVNRSVQPGARARLNWAASERAVSTAACAGRIPPGAGLEQTGLRPPAQPRPR
jgi:hypothetical protein